jgi:hypothetical protein
MQAERLTPPSPDATLWEELGGEPGAARREQSSDKAAEARVAGALKANELRFNEWADLMRRRREAQLATDHDDDLGEADGPGTTHTLWVNAADENEAVLGEWPTVGPELGTTKGD